MKKRVMVVTVIAIALAVATGHRHIHAIKNNHKPATQEQSTVMTADVFTEFTVLPGNVLLYFLY